MYWQPSIVALRASAREGCELCLNVWDEMVMKDTAGNDETCSRIDAEITETNISGSETPSWELCFMMVRSDYGSVTAVVGSHQFAKIQVLGSKQTCEASHDKYAGTGTGPMTRDLTTAKWWFKHCRAEHTICRHGLKRDGFHPSRLIKVEKADGIVEARLLEGDDIPRELEYATLSHCLGSGPLKTLKSHNLGDYKKTIPVNELAKTFRDAFQVILDLQLSYIWIDSLCIIQDSSDDWSNECQVMADVYESATLNVAATAFKSSNSGLFVPKRSWCPKALQVTAAISSGVHSLFGDYSLVHDDAWVIRVNNAPLNRRGWVLQERFFSSRILHFGKDQLLWECQELQTAETMCSPELLPRNTQRLNGDRSYRDLIVCAAQMTQSCSDMGFHYCEGVRETLRQSWNAMIEAYTRSDLTYGSDKLIAIAGVMSRFKAVTQDVCIFGLWKHNFELDLLWYRSSTSGTATRPALQLRAPTWSWACLDGPITFHHQKEITSFRDSGHVSSCDTNSGTIYMHALLLKIAIQESRLSDQCDAAVSAIGFYKRLHVTMHFDAKDSDIPNLEDAIGFPNVHDTDSKCAYLVCLITERPSVGLILRRASGFGCYSRIGFFSTKDDLRPSSPWFQHDDKDHDSTGGEPGLYNITLV